MSLNIKSKEMDKIQNPQLQEYKNNIIILAKRKEQIIDELAGNNFMAKSVVKIKNLINKQLKNIKFIDFQICEIEAAIKKIIHN